MEKDRKKALILCATLGYFGAHRFYEGKIGMGFLYLFTFGLGCVGWFVDIFLLLKKPEKYIVEKKEKTTKPERKIQNKNILCCKKCGSENIFVQVENVVSGYNSTTETRKKSVITNAGNSLGRTGMILATGGLWALTPKKSKYNSVQKGIVNTKQVKIAVCQNCGKSWRIYF